MATGGTTLARNLAAGAVAAIAAWSSYSHMVQVALRFGERIEVAYALPFSVDGMLVVATVAMADDRRHGRRVRPIARLAFAAGVTASVAANIAAAQPQIGARVVAAWPAVALLLVVEMLARSPAAAAAEPATAGAVHQPPHRRHGHELPVPPPEVTDDSAAAVAGRAGARTRAVGRRRPTAETRREAETLLAAEPELTRAELAARLGVSTRRLREVLASDHAPRLRA